MEKENKHHPSENKETRLSKNVWIKYSSLSFQMIAIIFLGFFGGLEFDKYLNLKFPIFTIVFSLLSIFAAIWFAIKDFLKK